MKPKKELCKVCITPLSHADESPLCHVCRYGYERTVGTIRTLVWGCAG